MTLSTGRSVFILDDVKRGHLNQSLAVAQLIPEAHIHTVPVIYKTWFTRGLMNVFCHMAWSEVLRKTYLKLCLKNWSCDSLLSEKKAVIVSTGSVTEPVNYLLSTESKTNIAILKPLRLKKFDLIIVHGHDKIKEKKNVLSTTLALSKFNAHELKVAALNLKQKLQLPDTKFVSIFIGVHSRFYSIDFSHLEPTLNNLGQSSLHTLITVSRRTPIKVIEQIKVWHKKNSYKASLVLEEGEAAVKGMLGLAECIFVTEDSVSMISEALYSGKKPFIINLRETKKSKKLQKLKQLLNDRKYIVDASKFNEFKNNFSALYLNETSLEEEKNKIKDKLLEIL